jgi:hypothetical protein
VECGNSACGSTKLQVAVEAIVPMDAHSGRDLGARAQSDRSPTAAPKWQPARDFGDRHIMRMQLPIISRASPMLLLCSVKLDQSRFD